MFQCLMQHNTHVHFNGWGRTKRGGDRTGQEVRREPADENEAGDLNSDPFFRQKILAPYS